MTPKAQARQALKAAVNGQKYGNFVGYDCVGASPTNFGGVLLTKEAARLIDRMLAEAHYQAEAEKAERDDD